MEAKLNEFGLKDSGKREEFDSGMVRDTEEGKIDYSLVFDGPMLKRWAEHLTKGAKKYAPRNWMKATGDAEYERFKRSLLRHLVAYLNGERDEDHAAAIIFNVNGMEYVREQQENLQAAGDAVRDVVRRHAAGVIEIFNPEHVEHMRLLRWVAGCPDCEARAYDVA